ncbi:MAG: metallophosphoesterase [Calditrichaeota bacterium]|nr:metallophosphoesterase [Calditrichota bacterium]
MAILLLPLFSLFAQETEPLPKPKPRRFVLSGEYGLWVTRSMDSCRVHWITEEKGAGFLEAVQDGKSIFRLQTPDSLAHQARFPIPDPARPYTLVYGAQGNNGDRHRSTIYPKPLPEDRLWFYAEVDTVITFGDLHGQYENLVTLLRQHAIIDDSLRWQGGKAHLVLLGDIFDRGHDVIKTLWFIYRLEREAHLAGGRVHLVLGNHEIMVFLDDLRYVSGKEQLIARYHGTTYARMFDMHQSVLGEWLAGKPGIIRINDGLFSHGGVSRELLDFTIPAFNDSLRRYLFEPDFLSLIDEQALKRPQKTGAYVRRLNFFFAEYSAFWFRGYVNTNDLRLALTEVLKRFQVDFQVVAHTPVDYIRTFYGGEIIAVDLNRPATEMLMLLRGSDGGQQRYRYLIGGKEKPL